MSTMPSPNVQLLGLRSLGNPPDVAGNAACHPPPQETGITIHGCPSRHLGGKSEIDTDLYVSLYTRADGEPVPDTP
jgi:hypothetical protein